MIEYICENCQKQTNIKYGSGRFCTNTCARSFSTKSKRKEINDKVSKKLKNRKPTGNTKPFQKGFDPRRKTWSKEERIELSKRVKAVINEKYMSYSFDDLPYPRKKKRVFSEQNNSCLICKITKWNGKSITFELDHIDGNNKNNDRTNLRVLCPNCHSQTDTWKSKRVSGLEKITDEEIINALQTYKSINLALKSLNLAWAGNIHRINKIIKKYLL